MNFNLPVTIGNLFTSGSCPSSLSKTSVIRETHHSPALLSPIFIGKNEYKHLENKFGVSNMANFSPIETDRELIVDVRLPFADFHHINYIAKEKKSSVLPIPAWQNRFEFYFGRLSQAEFELLKNYYGAFGSDYRIIHDQQKKYWLTDFLPPVIRHFSGKKFIPSTTPVSEELWERLGISLAQNQRPISSLYTNCWGIAYEALRGSSQVELFVANGALMANAMRQQSSLLLSTDDRTYFPDHSLLRPGDIVLISHSFDGKEYLDHTAIVIDGGLYFEKAGSGEQTPIRIIDDEQIFTSWTPGIFKYEWRRPKVDARWENPRNIFSLKSAEILEKFPELHHFSPSFLENYSIDWETDQDIRTYLSLFQFETVHLKD